MRNINKRLVSLFLSSLFLMSCNIRPIDNNPSPDDDPNIHDHDEDDLKKELRIEVSKLPNKTIYDLGEELDFTGLVVQVVYLSGNKDNIEEYEITRPTLDHEGDYDITITYHEMFTTFKVSVLTSRDPFIDYSYLYLENRNDTIYLTVEGHTYGYDENYFNSNAFLYLENNGTYDGSGNWNYACNKIGGNIEIQGAIYKMRFGISDVNALVDTKPRAFVTHFELLYTVVSGSKSTPDTTIGNLKNVPLKKGSTQFELNEHIFTLYIWPDYSLPSISIDPINQEVDPGEGTDPSTNPNAIHSKADEPIEKSDNTKYYLGDYGDYVEWVDKTKDPALLEALYEDLDTIDVTDVNTLRHIAYKRGLLQFFDISNKIEFNIQISMEELTKLNQDNKSGNRESYRICDLDITMLGLRFHLVEVGIRQKGNTSRGDILDGNRVNVRHYKLKFKEQFDDEFTDTPMYFNNDKAKKYRKKRTFFGIEKIDIRRNTTADQTFIREYYSYEGYRANGGISGRSTPINVKMTIDGDTQNMGIFLACECLDDTFLERNYKEGYELGNLYKVGYGANFDNPYANFGVESQTKNQWGGYSTNTPQFDLKTNKKTPDHTWAQDFLTGLRDADYTNIYQYMTTHTYYDDYITYLALGYLNGDADDLRGNTNNTYLYMVSGIEGSSSTAVIMPQDNDQSLGAAERDFREVNPTGSRGALCQPFESHTGHGDSWNCYVFSKTIYDTRSTQIRSDYLNKVNQVIKSGWFTPEHYKSYYDKVYANYNDCTTLGNRIIGTQNTFSFTADTDPATGRALDITTYITLKTQTFYNWCTANNFTFAS